MRLVLFDIDGTLVAAGGQAKPLFEEAMVEVYGTAGAIDDYDFAGKTDPQIVFELLEVAGVPHAEIAAGLPLLRDGYLDRLAARLDPRRVRILPGVGELLSALSLRDDLVLGLLTGNWERGARIKLASVDLFRYFPFGGFGDDGHSRRDLPPVALARACAYAGRDFSQEETVIVGDSLLDVDCAHANGIRCLAVATGKTESWALARAGADWVEPDLTRAHAHPAFARLDG